jgi:putative membrane protein
MGTIVKRYSSLFTLPSRQRIILSLFASCLAWGALAIWPSRPSYDGLGLGLAFGVYLFLIAVSSDFAISRLFIERDPIFNFRRCTGLSLFSSLIWLGLIFLGTIISIFLEDASIWIKSFLLGFCAVLMLRLVVFSTTSSADSERILLSSILQPALFMISALFAASAMGIGLTASLILFIPLSILAVGLTVLLFILYLNRAGEKAVGIPSLSLFKAFAASWTEDLNEPLEKLFETLGGERDVSLSLLAFKGNRGMKAVIVVPGFHSGPFRNVGSSLFPSMIQQALEKKLRCVVSVPHGLFGHSLDLSSQVQSRKVIDIALDSLDFPSFKSEITPLMRVGKNGASASCQIFGDCAFLTLTLAPETMEDLPEEVNSAIVSEAEKRGLSPAIVVDAHNSIDGPFNLEKVVNPLKTAAVASLEEALSCQRYPLSIGASKVVPEEYELKDGMGPGGISVIVTKVGDQKVAYVTIDGNNMISGLREKTLSVINELGISAGEILTTDTHAVNGVVLVPRGYHPVGEAMDQSRLIEYIKEATVTALNNLEPVEVAWSTKTVADIKVIGEKQIEALSGLSEKVAKQAKKLAVTMFPTTGIFLTVLLAFL